MDGATGLMGEARGAPLVAHVFPSFAVGGAQVRFAAIANHFGPAFRHLVVALDGDLACRERLRPDLDLTFPAVAAARGAMIANAWRYRGLLRAWRPDVLVTCNWGAIEFALANVLPVTRHLHVVDGFGPEEREAQIARRVLTRRLVLRRTPVVLPSRRLVRIAADVWKLPRSVVRYVPNGIDLARFATGGGQRFPGRIPGRFPGRFPGGGTGVSSGGPVIGTVAALRREKNIGRLLRAFAMLSSGRLVVVGDGPERGALEALSAALGVSERVRFAGHHQDTPGFYAQFDIFALSSDTEQMPLSVIEAMASGLPVVSTDVGDIGQMLTSENLPYVTRLDDAALAAALGGLMADPDLCLRIGVANLAKARRDFDQSAMFAAYAALWRGEADASAEAGRDVSAGVAQEALAGVAQDAVAGVGRQALVGAGRDAAVRAGQDAVAGSRPAPW
ncbi:glycosyltransferase [Rhodopila sp.]|uniref:glycosyltransferase n=1 Tax=Rhodopila sp. TaxID=2480087 RepID=UPI003D127466